MQLYTSIHGAMVVAMVFALIHIAEAADTREGLSCYKCVSGYRENEAVRKDATFQVHAIVRDHGFWLPWSWMLNQCKEPFDNNSVVPTISDCRTQCYKLVLTAKMHDSEYTVVARGCKDQLLESLIQHLFPSVSGSTCCRLAFDVAPDRATIQSLTGDLCFCSNKSLCNGYLRRGDAKSEVYLQPVSSPWWEQEREVTEATAIAPSEQVLGDIVEGGVEESFVLSREDAGTTLPKEESYSDAVILEESTDRPGALERSRESYNYQTGRVAPIYELPQQAGGGQVMIDIVTYNPPSGEVSSNEAAATPEAWPNDEASTTPIAAVKATAEKFVGVPGGDDDTVVLEDENDFVSGDYDNEGTAQVRGSFVLLIAAFSVCLILQS